MSYDLRPVEAAIREGDKVRARQLLRPMLRQPTADVLYLAALVTDNRQQVIRVLEQALQLDPSHQRAAQTLAALTQARSTAPSSPPATLPTQQSPPADKSPSHPTLHGVSTHPEGHPSSRFKPRLPAVPEAITARAYRLSGHYSPARLTIVAAAGLALGVITGFIAHAGGKLLTMPLADGIAGWLENLSGRMQSTSGAGLAALIGLAMVSLVGLVYPILLSRALGLALWQMVKWGKVRHIRRAFAVTLISAVVSYGSFVWLAVGDSGMVHTTSGVWREFLGLEGAPWWLYLIVGGEGLLWVALATCPMLARITRTPFAETTGHWYDSQMQTALINTASAEALLNVLVSPEVQEPPGIIRVDEKHAPRLELKLRRCSADLAADHQLVVTLHWQEPRQSKPDRSGRTRITLHARSEDWFETMIPAQVGETLEKTLFTTGSPSNRPVPPNLGGLKTRFRR